MDLILFPELSISSYEPTLAKESVVKIKSKKLRVLQELSDQHRMIIVAGLPTESEEGIRISLAVFEPGRNVELYSKQYLHKDEVPYFVPGTDELTIHLDGRKLKPAICYESLLEEHAEKAASEGASVYLASVAKPAGGVLKAHEHYPYIAQKYEMMILMANSVGKCDNFLSAGGSGFWSAEGELIHSLPPGEEGLLIVDTELNVTDSVPLS